jgi:hypothetical protein
MAARNTARGRPTTPPPSSHLLTPPPTGGFENSVGFDNSGVSNSKSRRLNTSKEGESPSAFFEEPLEEDSEVDVKKLTDEKPISSTDTLPGSPAANISFASNSSIPNTHGLFAPLTKSGNAPASAEPFPFLKLPLSVRHKVYEHLLVVPAIICVRQKHAAYHDEKEAFLYTERREFLPGIAYALAQLAVDGYKIRFSRFAAANINIMYASKEVHAEARAVLYGRNNFEIIKPAHEMTPPPDFSVRLFPTGCQRLVAKLHMRIRSFYDLGWLLSGGYNDIKKFYRGLEHLTLILEFDSASKGFGRQWAKAADEKWAAYIQRLHKEQTKDVFGADKSKKVKAVPMWINLCIMFTDEKYDDMLQGRNVSNAMSTGEHSKRDELRRALVEAWELFKKGGR